MFWDRDKHLVDLCYSAQNNCGSIWMLRLYNTCQKEIMKRGLPIDVQLRPPLAKGWPIWHAAGWPSLTQESQDLIDVPCKHWVFIIQPLCFVRNWIPTFCTLKSQAFPIDSGHEIFRLHCMTFAKKGVAKGQVCITTHTLISELYKWFWSGGLFYFAWGNWWQTTAFQFDRFTYNSFAVARKDNSNSAHSVKENG